MPVSNSPPVESPSISRLLTCPKKVAVLICPLPWASWQPPARFPPKASKATSFSGNCPWMVRFGPSRGYCPRYWRLAKQAVRCCYLRTTPRKLPLPAVMMCLPPAICCQYVSIWRAVPDWFLFLDLKRRETVPQRCLWPISQRCEASKCPVGRWRWPQLAVTICCFSALPEPVKVCWRAGYRAFCQVCQMRQPWRWPACIPLRASR